MSHHDDKSHEDDRDTNLKVMNDYDHYHALSDHEEYIFLSIDGSEDKYQELFFMENHLKTLQKTNFNYDTET